MKALIYSHVPLFEVHHAETIELALKHLKAGDEVFLLSCFGDLLSCPANLFHDNLLCRRCIRQTQYTISTILGHQARDIRLDLSSYEVQLPEITNLEDLQRFTRHGVPFGALVLSQIGYAERSVADSFEAIRTRVNRLLPNAIALYERTRSLIQQHAIERTYVWDGGRSPEGPVAYAAAHEGNDVFSYISGGRRNRYALFRSLSIHDMRYSIEGMERLFREALLTKGLQHLEKEAEEFYHERRFGGGDYPGYVDFASQFDRTHRTPFAGERKVLAFFPSSYWEVFGMHDYLHPYPPYRNPYDALEAILNDPEIRARYEIFVRWHPYLQVCGARERERMEEIIGHSPHVNHLLPEDTTDTYALIEDADAVVTFGSTVGIEAVHYEKPSILLGRAVYEETGSVYVPKDHDELIRLLEHPLKPLDRTGALKYAHWMRNFGEYEFEYVTQDAHGRWFHDGRRIQLLSPWERIRSRFHWLQKQIGLEKRARLRW